MEKIHFISNLYLYDIIFYQDFYFYEVLVLFSNNAVYVMIFDLSDVMPNILLIFLKLFQM